MYGDPFDGYGIFSSESAFFQQLLSLKSKSLFGNVDYLFNENIKLSIGLRWENWKARYSDSNREALIPQII